MVLQMARPWRDPDSGIFYLRKRVPRALLPQVKGTTAMLPVGDEHVAVRVGDITKAEPNVHGGFKYLRQIHDSHLDTAGVDEQNRTLFAIASYNAGSGRVARLRAEAAQKNLDPNVWFNNVELVAARRIGQETVVYVRNIYKYYVAYKLQLERLEERRAAATKLAPTPVKGQ